MPRYSTRYDPPAPVATVTLRTVDQSGHVSNVAMSIDSASDMTLLPAPSVSQLALKPVRELQYEITAFDGVKSDSPVVTCEVVFLGRAFRGEYGVVQTDDGILGRDILNLLVLVLDGPRLTWREQE
jgi:hypothetical protein